MSSADGAPSKGSSWQKIKPKVKLVGKIAASLPKVAKPKKTSESDLPGASCAICVETNGSAGKGR